MEKFKIGEKIKVYYKEFNNCLIKGGKYSEFKDFEKHEGNICLIIDDFIKPNFYRCFLLNSNIKHPFWINEESILERI